MTIELTKGESSLLKSLLEGNKKAWEDIQEKGNSLAEGYVLPITALQEIGMVDSLIGKVTFKE